MESAKKSTQASFKTKVPHRICRLLSTMNKTECLDLLENVLKKIENNAWEAQVPDNELVLDHEDLKPYLEDFGLPEAEMNKNVYVSLPKGWLPNVSAESEDYTEVSEKYEEVYNFLLKEASREIEALNYMDECDERDRNNQFFSDCGLF
jgi:hypothetical protein